MNSIEIFRPGPAKPGLDLLQPLPVDPVELLQPMLEMGVDPVPVLDVEEGDPPSARGLKFWLFEIFIAYPL